MSDDDKELDDRGAFQYALLLASDLRVCACCGQEHSGLRIPDWVYASTDDIFRPLHGDLVLIDGEPIRLCYLCEPVLKKGDRPKWALRFPPIDARFANMSKLEFRLVRPMVPVISLIKLPGEGQFASTGGTVNFVNDSLKVAARLPRPVHQSGLVYIRSSTTSNSQVTREASVDPNEMRRVLSECIQDDHPAFRDSVLDPEVLASLEALNIDDVVLPVPTDLSAEELKEAEEDEERERNGIYGADASHNLIIDLPPEVGREDFLRCLFSKAPPNVPGEAEALPGDPNMLSRDVVQPRFPVESLVDEIALGRTIYARVFVQHFTNGHGGWDEAPEDMTEIEFIRCCAFYHTRQFQQDHEFCAFACTHGLICLLPLLFI